MQAAPRGGRVRGELQARPHGCHLFLEQGDHTAGCWSLASTSRSCLKQGGGKICQYVSCLPSGVLAAVLHGFGIEHYQRDCAGFEL